MKMPFEVTLEGDGLISRTRYGSLQVNGRLERLQAIVHKLDALFNLRRRLTRPRMNPTQSSWEAPALRARFWARGLHPGEQRETDAFSDTLRFPPRAETSSPVSAT